MDAASNYLNQPNRTKEQAAADIERQRRLGRFEPQLQDILEGANQTIYYPDGRVVEIKSKDEV